MLTFVSILIAAALLNNIALQHLLGLSPLLAVTRRLRIAIGLAGVVIYLAPLCGGIAFGLDELLLVLPGLEHFRYLLLLLCVFALIQLSDKPIRAIAPALAESALRFKGLLTMNSLLLATALLSLEQDAGLPGALLFGLGTGLGFALVLLAFTAIDARLQVAELPAPLKGLSIQLITLGIISLAFLGFAGLVRP
ncbi:MAG: Rnf-Nqr domain containing protein [Gammaproteobacteria bacterium]